LDCDVFFPIPAGIAGGTVAGEPLILALAIEPSTLLDPFNPPTEGADTMPTNDRAGDFAIRGRRLCLNRIGVVFAGESVERRVKDVLSAS
jgi:hypothetical protein